MQTDNGNLGLGCKKKVATLHLCKDIHSTVLEASHSTSIPCSEKDIEEQQLVHVRHKVPPLIPELTTLCVMKSASQREYQPLGGERYTVSVKIVPTVSVLSKTCNV